jgi:hypothetical protein
MKLMLLLKGSLGRKLSSLLPKRPRRMPMLSKPKLIKQSILLVLSFKLLKRLLWKIRLQLKLPRAFSTRPMPPFRTILMMMMCRRQPKLLLLPKINSLRPNRSSKLMKQLFLLLQMLLSRSKPALILCSQRKMPSFYKTKTPRLT